VLRRVLVQAPDSARAELADIVVENCGTHQEYIGALEVLWDQLLDTGTRNG
jgi:dephospho-CoA kinase